MECGWSFSDCVVRNDTTVWEDESYTGGNGGSGVKPGWKLGTWLQFVPTGLLKSLPVLLKDIQSKVQRLKKDQRGSCAPIPTSPVWNICGSPDRPSWELCVHTHGPYMYQMFASDAPPPEVQKRPTWTWSIICFESVDTVQFLISKNRNTLKCIRFPLPSENRLNIFRGQIYYRMLNREKKPQIWGHITHDSEEDLQASIEAFPLPKSLRTL